MIIFEFEISGTTVTTRALNGCVGCVSSSALYNLSTHGIMNVLPVHCLQKGRETPSTLLCKRPGRCWISTSSSARVSTQRARIPSGSLNVLDTWGCNDQSAGWLFDLANNAESTGVRKSQQEVHALWYITILRGIERTWKEGYRPFYTVNIVRQYSTYSNIWVVQIQNGRAAWIGKYKRRPLISDVD